MGAYERVPCREIIDTARHSQTPRRCFERAEAKSTRARKTHTPSSQLLPWGRNNSTHIQSPVYPSNFSRLQTLTSLKNRQNALSQSLASSTKRKAASYDDDIDAENIDPTLSTKRSKGSESSTSKPSAFVLTKAPLDFTPTSPTTRTTVTP
ncbi:hypothetical protein O988_07405, partial [Pseudogymnoascus sp. VKM F-3808]